MAYNSLTNYYQVMFSMVQHHKYSITELESLIPFERDLYLGMLIDYIEEQNKNQGKGSYL